ncbi:MAG: type II toxin-antitoxin system RelB/DinJ family antitoxin [Enterobacteriaceae bacterium]
MSTSIVRAIVSSEVKTAAMANAKALGMDISTVIRLVVNRLAATGTLPAELLQPNPETLEAIRELESGNGHTVSTIDELKRELGW